MAGALRASCPEGFREEPESLCSLQAAKDFISSVLDTKDFINSVLDTNDIEGTLAPLRQGCLTWSWRKAKKHVSL